MRASVADAVAQRLLSTPRLATRLMGDAIAGNLFLLGYAWQQGMVPVSFAAIDQAIELNGTAVPMNRQAFLWGRRAAHGLAAVEAYAKPPQAMAFKKTPTLEELVALRIEQLTAYQDAAYAARYAALVERVRQAEAVLGGTRLAQAVARYYFKLLAIKDEYEVARLYAESDFLDNIAASFEGDYTLRFHLAPPLLARPDPVTGVAKKSEFGPWMMGVFHRLAKLRRLRGTRWDIFGHSAERKLERQLIGNYEEDIAAILSTLSAPSAATLSAAVELACLPEQIRGYGHVKMKSISAARAQRESLREQLCHHPE